MKNNVSVEQKVFEDLKKQLEKVMSGGDPDKFKVFQKITKSKSMLMESVSTEDISKSIIVSSLKLENIDSNEGQMYLKEYKKVSAIVQNNKEFCGKYVKIGIDLENLTKNDPFLAENQRSALMLLTLFELREKYMADKKDCKAT